MSKISIVVYQNNNQYSPAYKKYYGRVKHSSTVDVQMLCNHVAMDSGIEVSNVAVVFDALLKQIKEQLCGGHPIKVDGLGSMKVGIKSKGVGAADVKKRYPNFDPEKEDIRKYLSARQVEGAHLLFTASDDIKTLLRAVKFETDKSEWESENPGEAEAGSDEEKD